MKRSLIILYSLLFSVQAFAYSGQFKPNVQAVGDPNVSYANVEFTEDNRYMVWFELDTDGGFGGTVWHCAVDQDSGELIPPDCKGFKAFTGFFWGRANPGADSKGSYYVGADKSGRLITVRPTGATTGEKRTLLTPPDVTRRAIYPTFLPGNPQGFVFWIKNEKTPGTIRGNDWFELQYINLAAPQDVHIITRQNRPRRGFAPMDIAFTRWMKGRPLLTHGAYDENGNVQIMSFNPLTPTIPSKQLTFDDSGKVDPYSWAYKGREYLFPGIDGKAIGHIYSRNQGDGEFRLTGEIQPYNSTLDNPGLLQSVEPFEFGGRPFAVYQVNNRKRRLGFWNTAFKQPGEIWLTSLLNPEQQWKLTPTPDIPVAEPEPYVGKNKVWIFYNVMPQDGNIFGGIWRLYRSETPLKKN